MLSTEIPDPRHSDLDQINGIALTDAFINDQLHAVHACQRVSHIIAQVVDAASERLLQGGRLLYAGAGTSGRLGLLDSVELYPTFSWPPERAQAILAGGQQALFQAVEGAEDDELAGATDLLNLKPQAQDVLLAIAASGRTPYVLGALHSAHQVGCLRVAISNNADSPITHHAEYSIVLDTGPEVIAGSTRLKAGTAQKIALNTLSSAIMVRLHKVHGNLMVDVKATNHKLVERATSLVMSIAGANQQDAKQALQQCNHEVKTAIIMLKHTLAAPEARQHLINHDDDLRTALQNHVTETQSHRSKLRT